MITLNPSSKLKGLKIGYKHDPEVQQVQKSHRFKKSWKGLNLLHRKSASLLPTSSGELISKCLKERYQELDWKRGKRGFIS